jgi:hypothetical protein
MEHGQKFYLKKLLSISPQMKNFYILCVNLLHKDLYDICWLHLITGGAINSSVYQQQSSISAYPAERAEI